MKKSISFFGARQYLTVVFILLVCHNGFSRDVDMPIITLQVDKQLKGSFYNTMLYLAENPGSDAQSIDFGTSILGPLGLSVNGSYMIFKNINGLLSIPLFVGGAVGMQGRSVSAGSGIIVKNQFFLLGIMAGLYTGMITSETGAARWERGTTTTKIDFGLFPVIDMEKYPFFNLFLKSIDGFVYSNEPEVKDIKISTINYLLNISLKRFLRLSVLDLYMRNGANDFMYGYDLSNYTVVIENLANRPRSNTFSQVAYDLGGNQFSISGAYDAKIYKTTRYGLRVGGDFFMMDLSYLTINDNLVAYDPTINDVVDYKYPFGLNGFPSVTFNFSYERKKGWFDGDLFFRFSTLNQIGISFVPEIGITQQSKFGAFFLTWTPPAIFGVGFRIME